MNSGLLAIRHERQRVSHSLAGGAAPRPHAFPPRLEVGGDLEGAVAPAISHFRGLKLGGQSVSAAVTFGAVILCRVADGDMGLLAAIIAGRGKRLGRGDGAVDILGVVPSQAKHVPARGRQSAPAGRCGRRSRPCRRW